MLGDVEMLLFMLSASRDELFDMMPVFGEKLELLSVWIVQQILTGESLYN